MSDEAERAFEKWADSPHGRIPSSAPEAHEAFIAGFEAGRERSEERLLAGRADRPDSREQRFFWSEFVRTDKRLKNTEHDPAMEQQAEEP